MMRVSWRWWVVLWLAGTGYGDEALRARYATLQYPPVLLENRPNAAFGPKYNPPSLMWPRPETLPHKAEGRYQVRLSQDPSFPPGATIESGERHWNIYNPHQRLAPGAWYWQVKDLKDPQGGWGPVTQFTLTGNEPVYDPPAFADWVGKAKAAHPRLLATPEELARLRTLYSQKQAQYDGYVANLQLDAWYQAKPALIYNAPETVEALRKKGLSEAEVLRYCNRKTFEQIAAEMRKIDGALRAYVLTGQPRFREMALDRFLQLYALYEDPALRPYTDGDFSLSEIATLSASLCDLLGDAVPAEVHARARERMEAQARKLYREYHGELELEPTSEHAWQTHVRTLLELSLALLGEVPEADEWCEYVYDLWIAKAPVDGLYDGGCAVGISYDMAHYKTLLEVPLRFGAYTGYDFFSIPWYRNVVDYYLYTTLPIHYSCGFGDYHSVRFHNAYYVNFVSLMGLLSNDPRADWFRQQSLAYDDRLKNAPARVESQADYPTFKTALILGTRSLLKWDEGTVWYLVKNGIFEYPSGDTAAVEASLAPAKAFKDTGVAMMHTELAHPERNLMVAFRSSPFGAAYHMHADQNSFNILYGGLPVFYRTGYYTSWADFHTLQSYRHTRAHNTVLPDGMSQSYTYLGFGAIEEFKTGKTISYVRGDASQAYQGQPLTNNAYIEQLQQYGVELSDRNGLGATSLTRFKRHLLLLRPSTVVVFDELEAREPTRWDWKIHALDPLRSTGPGQLAVTTSNATGRLLLCSDQPLTLSITDQFHAEAKDFLNNIGKKGYSIQPQWHATFSTAPSRRAYFLGVMQIEDKTQPPAPLYSMDGAVYAGDWQLEYEPATGVLSGRNRAGQSFRVQPRDNAYAVDVCE